jgi:hypothetical protein
MKKSIRLVGTVAIAMALIIAFYGVATASYPVPPTSETENLDITTTIISNRMVVESEGLGLEIGSGNLLDNPPLANDEIYGKIRYDEKMIGLNGTTNFSKVFSVDTKTAPNLAVTKNIGYKQGELGSLSYAEQVELEITVRDAPEDDDTFDLVKQLCPFDWTWEGADRATTKLGNCEGVNTYSEMVVTEVLATAETNVGITEGDPVSLGYEITAEGDGFVAAGVGVYAEDGRGGHALGSRWIYNDKSIAYGEFTFCKDVGYLANQP